MLSNIFNKTTAIILVIAVILLLLDVSAKNLPRKKSKSTIKLAKRLKRDSSEEINENLFENITFTFDCRKRPAGFYADIEFNCQIFHMCSKDSYRIPHICVNGTSFNQEFRICDWDYNFECKQSEKWYHLNELIYDNISKNNNNNNEADQVNELIGHKMVINEVEDNNAAEEEDDGPQYLIDIKK